jgi:hypothetical protein
MVRVSIVMMGKNGRADPEAFALGHVVFLDCALHRFLAVTASNREGQALGLPPQDEQASGAAGAFQTAFSCGQDSGPGRESESGFLAAAASGQP